MALDTLIWLHGAAWHHLSEVERLERIRTVEAYAGGDHDRAVEVAARTEVDGWYTITWAGATAGTAAVTCHRGRPPELDRTGAGGFAVIVMNEAGSALEARALRAPIDAQAEEQARAIAQEKCGRKVVLAQRFGRHEGKPAYRAVAQFRCTAQADRASEAAAKTTDAAWDGDKARFDIDQLKRAVPKAVREWAEAKAETEGRELVKGDLKLPFKEPDGTVNLNGVRAALAAIGGSRSGRKPAMPAEVLAAARDELEAILDKAKASEDKLAT